MNSRDPVFRWFWRGVILTALFGAALIARCAHAADAQPMGRSEAALVLAAWLLLCALLCWLAYQAHRVCVAAFLWLCEKRTQARARRAARVQPPYSGWNRLTQQDLQR